MDRLTQKIQHLESQLDLTEETITNVLIYKQLVNSEISNYLHALERHHTKVKSILETLHKADNIILHDDTHSYKLWRDKVLMRDKYTCQRCNSIHHLTAHHIISKRNTTELQWEPNNGITLCKSCHDEWNTLYEESDPPTSVFLKWLHYTDTKK